MGDPAGIGPEIVVRAFNNPVISESAQLFVIGSSEPLLLAMQQTGIELPILPILGPEQCLEEPGIQLLTPPGLSVDKLTQGSISAAAGYAAVNYFESAVNLCLQGQLAAVVTCPIHKEAVQLAGYQNDIGHQEILARMTQSELTATMLMTQGLKVAHLSTHKSLADAVSYVRRPVIVEKLRLTDTSLKQWGISRPTIAVAALNPHGGEGGMLGREEIDEIAPAVAEACAQGLDIRGPYPADSIFYRAINGEFDAVLALFHDQGHIAIKVHNFADSITATMGIPFIRTSVDHGTAFDIAGQNQADETGLLRAIAAATAMLNRNLS